jgi:hypothetical protein
LPVLLRNAIWPLSGRETNEINSNAKSKFTPSQPLTVGLPQSKTRALGSRSGKSAFKLVRRKFYSRSHDAVIRVYDDAGNVIHTHEHAGEFKE